MMRYIVLALLAIFLTLDADAQGKRGSVDNGGLFSRKVKRGSGNPPGARTSKPLKKRKKSKKHTYGAKISRKQYKRGGVFFKARNSSARGLGGDFKFKNRSRKERRKSALFETKRRKSRYGTGNNFPKRYRKNKNFKKDNFGRTAKLNRRRVKRKGALFNAKRYERQNNRTFKPGDRYRERTKRKNRIKKDNGNRNGSIFNKRDRQYRRLNRKRKRQLRNNDFSYSPRKVSKQRRNSRRRKEGGLFPRSVKPY